MFEERKAILQACPLGPTNSTVEYFDRKLVSCLWLRVNWIWYQAVRYTGRLTLKGTSVDEILMFFYIVPSADY